MRYRPCLILAAIAFATALPSHAQQPAQPQAAGAAPLLDPAERSLPSAPSATLAPAPGSSAETPVALPSSFRPAWAVDRSRLGDKLSYYGASVGSPRNFLEAFLLMGTFTLPKAPVQPAAPSVVNINTATIYQQEMDDYGDAIDGWRHASETILRFKQRRLEVGIATAETRQLLSDLALPIALHQEARYRPANIDASFGERMANAAESIVLTHDDHGRVVPNYSKLGGTVAAAFLGRTVYASGFKAPELETTHYFTHYIAYSLAGDLATNVAHEVLRAAIQPDMDVYNLHGRSTEDSYYPLSAGGKFVYWARSTSAPRVFLQAGLTAGLPSIGDQPQEPAPGVMVTTAQALAYDQAYVAYGEAIEAWRRGLENSLHSHERRLIAGAATVETQMTIQNLVVPMLLGIDSRYIPLGPGYDSGTRVAHAVRGLVMTRTDSGGKAINLPVLLGTVGSAYLGKEAYYPALRTPGLESNSMLVRTISLNFAADVIFNLGSEFLHHRGY